MKPFRFFSAGMRRAVFPLLVALAMIAAVPAAPRAEDERARPGGQSEPHPEHHAPALEKFAPPVAAGPSTWGAQLPGGGTGQNGWAQQGAFPSQPPVGNYGPSAGGVLARCNLRNGAGCQFRSDFVPPSGVACHCGEVDGVTQ